MQAHFETTCESWSRLRSRTCNEGKHYLRPEQINVKNCKNRVYRLIKQRIVGIEYSEFAVVTLAEGSTKRHPKKTKESPPPHREREGVSVQTTATMGWLKLQSDLYFCILPYHLVFRLLLVPLVDLIYIPQIQQLLTLWSSAGTRAREHLLPTLHLRKCLEYQTLKWLSRCTWRMWWTATIQWTM